MVIAMASANCSPCSVRDTRMPACATDAMKQQAITRERGAVVRASRVLGIALQKRETHYCQSIVSWLTKDGNRTVVFRVPLETDEVPVICYKKNDF